MCPNADILVMCCAVPAESCPSNSQSTYYTVDYNQKKKCNYENLFSTYYSLFLKAKSNVFEIFSEWNCIEGACRQKTYWNYSIPFTNYTHLNSTIFFNFRSLCIFKWSSVPSCLFSKKKNIYRVLRVILPFFFVKLKCVMISLDYFIQKLDYFWPKLDCS